METGLPKGRRLIDTKWVLKRKVNKFGEVERYKGRLVAKCSRQIEGVDFHYTFAPMPSPADWEVLHRGVRQAFVQAEVKEDIYIRLCDGCGRLSGIVAKLVKSLHGCRQSSRTFCLLLVQVVEEIGFEWCKADPCILRLVSAEKVCTLITPHVDDLMVAGVCNTVEAVRKRIEAWFPFLT
ncbi:unnamed protein product [Discosporangium mesarthrocarpum]